MEIRQIIRERLQKLRGCKIGNWQKPSIVSGVDLLVTVCRVVPVNGWLKFSLLKFGVTMPFFSVSGASPQNTHTQEHK